MAVLAERITAPAPVADDNLASHVEQPRFRHQKPAIAKLLPVIGRAVLLGIEPFLFSGGDVAECPSLRYRVDLQHLIFSEYPIYLHRQEIEDGRAEQSGIWPILRFFLVRVARPA